MLRDVPVIVSVKVAEVLCGGELESVTVNVNGVTDTAAVGVPAIAPLELKVNPGGSVPAVNCQVYGGVPPVASRPWKYAAPTTPLLSDPVVIPRKYGNCKVAVAVSSGLLASVTSNTSTLPPVEAVVVPLITPAGLRVNPAGSLPLFRLQVYGIVPPVAVSVCEYGVPTTVVFSEVVVIVRVEALATWQTAPASTARLALLEYKPPAPFDGAP